MTFNPLEEKGISLEKQVRSWYDIVKRPFCKHTVNCYSRTRQILMNGIEVEAWNFEHNFSRSFPDIEVSKLISQTRRIENMQQITVNWMTPAEQSVLETTLGYEQVAVDLTAWLAQNEPDEYVKEAFNFGLLEDFDHLYRYSQWAYMIHGLNPDDILQGMTDVIIGRPTQHHHNCSGVRQLKHYDRTKASPQTKVNIYTLLSGEQQTHNFYAEHGMMYGNDDLRRTYGEICDVEEEHVTMYESLIDPNETSLEKLLLHEFTEVCTYYNCYEDEENENLKQIWEEFLGFELGHLQIAANLLKKHEKRDPEEIIGNKIILPCRFKSQKEYVTDILDKEINKRMDGEKGYTTVDKLSDNWASYVVQNAVNKNGAPSEHTIHLINTSINSDIVTADEELRKKEPELLRKGLQTKSNAPNTVSIENYEKMVKQKPIKF